MIGVEAPPGQDLFTHDTIARISKGSTAMRNLSGVENVVSITKVEDVVASLGGADLRDLVERVPEGEAEERALRDKVMARDHIVGSLVSKDGRAALIMVFLTDGAKDRVVTDAIRQARKRAGAADGLFRRRASSLAATSTPRRRTTCGACRRWRWRCCSWWWCCRSAIRSACY